MPAAGNFGTLLGAAAVGAAAVGAAAVGCCFAIGVEPPRVGAAGNPGAQGNAGLVVVMSSSLRPGAGAGFAAGAGGAFANRSCAGADVPPLAILSSVSPGFTVYSVPLGNLIF